MTTIGTLPDSTRDEAGKDVPTWGFDANTVVSPDSARRFKEAGASFAVRYVKRAVPHSFDISMPEVLALLNAGLGVMVVQHVAPPEWMPGASLGMVYGDTAAAGAKAAGLPSGVNVWCDLEGVGTKARSSDVVNFCNKWHDAVERAGYLPGLYVGDRCGLSADELYHELRFAYYWGAYNLNRENFPAVRGLCMKQHEYPPLGQRVPDVSFEYDVDIIRSDALGNSPVLYLP